MWSMLSCCCLGVIGRRGCFSSARPAYTDIGQNDDAIVALVKNLIIARLITLTTYLNQVPDL